MGMPKWPAAVKGFESLTIKDQPIAFPIEKDDPQSLYLLNIGSFKHARTQFACSAAKNLYAVPLDVLIRIAKVVTFYNILFAKAKTPLSQRAISWLTDLGRIVISPLSWVIVIIAGLYAAAHPSACARNTAIKLENALLENDKLDYLKPMTRAEVDSWASAHQIPQPTPTPTPTPQPAPTPTPTPTPINPLTVEEQRTLDRFTPQMVEALGGMEKVLSIPTLADWDGTMNPKCMTAPVVISGTSAGVCLLFCYWHLEKGGYQVRCEVLARRDKGWEGVNCYDCNEMSLRAAVPVLDGSLTAKYMLEKISRLMQGKAVGTVQLFHDVSLVVTNPKNKVTSRPNDAYLKDDALLDYMDAHTIFYEREPKAGTTEIFLYDPSKTRKQNLGQLFKRFPAMQPKKEAQ